MGETLNTYDEINIIGLAEGNLFRQHKILAPFIIILLRQKEQPGTELLLSIQHQFCRELCQEKAVLSMCGKKFNTLSIYWLFGCRQALNIYLSSSPPRCRSI